MKACVTSSEIRQALTSVGENTPEHDALIAEAASNKTPSGRLAELAKSDDPFVQLAALKNPNTLNDAFFDAIFG